MRGNVNAQKALNYLLDETTGSPASLDLLKRNLGFLGQQERGTEAGALIERLRNNLKQSMTSSPTMQQLGYGDANAEYATFKALMKQVNPELSLNAKNDLTAVRKLNQIFRDNFKSRNNLMAQLENAIGGDAMNRLAGIEASNLAPGGIRNVVGGSALASLPYMAMTGNLGGAAGVLASEASMSPRLNAEFWSLLGKSANQYNKLKNSLPPEVLNRLIKYQLLSEANN
jgi:hypothetical protein